MHRKLRGVHPELVEKVEKIIRAMGALGYRMIVTDGVRTADRQAELYAQGRSAPGDIVTQLDGFVVKSNHQAQADGWGHAVDCAFMIDNDVTWDESCPWALYGAMAKALDLEWGGDWKRFPDRPHVELP